MEHLCFRIVQKRRQRHRKSHPQLRPIHDELEQEKLFIYSTYPSTTRAGSASSSMGPTPISKSPMFRGRPVLYPLGDLSTFDSADLNENQNEQEYYGVVSYQKSTDQFSMLASAFYRYGQIFISRPTRWETCMLQGVGGRNTQFAIRPSGLQMDSIVHPQRSAHRSRRGLIADYTVERNDTNTSVFPGRSQHRRAVIHHSRVHRGRHAQQRSGGGSLSPG